MFEVIEQGIRGSSRGRMALFDGSGKGGQVLLHAGMLAEMLAQAGVGNVLDVLSAQSALAGARLQRIQAQLDWHVYRATLAQAMGALDDTLLRAAAQERP